METPDPVCLEFIYNIVACLLKARIVKPSEAAVARKRLRKCALVVVGVFCAVCFEAA
jgi:hypothetical protein